MLMILSILLPMLGAIDVFLIKEDKKRRVVTAFLVIVSAAVAVVAAMTNGGEVFTLMHISPALTLSFAADELSIFFIVLVSLIWCFVQFHAFGYMPHEGGENRFFGFFLLTYGALIALALAANAVTMYMCFELMTLFSMPLVLHNGSEVSRDASIKYLGYSTLGAALALMGFFLFSLNAGSLEFATGGVPLNGDTGILLVSCFLIVLGFGAKAGLVPLQMWLTEAHPVAPSPASAVLSGLITKGGVIAIIRSVFYLFGADFVKGTWVQTAILSLAVITIFFGSMLAYREKLLKKRLAYSTISNVSYVLFGLFTFSQLGFAGALLQVVFHALAKDALFLCAGSIIFATHKTYVSELTGIGRRMPVTMWCFAIAALSLIGIPPAGGFVAKWYLAIGALQSGSVLQLVGVIVLMVSALLTAFYLLPIVAKAFFPGKDYPVEEACEVETKMLVPVVVFSALVILLGIAPGGINQFITALAGTLM